MKQEFVTLPREVVEQALESLLNEGNFRKLMKPLIEESIKQIKAALEQPPTTEQSSAVERPQGEQERVLPGGGLAPLYIPPQPQREPEPVAWMNATGGTTFDSFRASCWRDKGPVTPLYTHPQPKREPLTDEQIESACLYYRHDLGLLSQQQKNQIKFQAIEWNAALEKARAHNIK